MTNHKYPKGAVRAVEELQPLLARAEAGETVKVYTVKLYGKEALIETSIVKRLHQGSLIIAYDERLNASFLLEDRNIPWFEEGPDTDKWFLFTNYWLAHAEVCRRQAQGKKNVDG